MAGTAYSTVSPETRKHWASKTFKEMLTETYAFRFAGTSDGSMIQIKEDLQKGKGDVVKTFLRAQLSGRGVINDATLQGNGESLTHHKDEITIGYQRHAVASDGKLSEQRVAWEFRPAAKDALKDWWRKRIDTVFFNQVTGNTTETDMAYLGHNSAVAPTRVVMEADATASISSGTTFGIRLLDYAVEQARTGTYPMRPVVSGGKEYYILFLHEYQATDLRREFGSGGWGDIHKAAIQGGAGTNDPIFTGALGVYNNVIIHTSNYLPIASSICRAALCGAQAVGLAFGQKSGVDTYMNWTEEIYDHENKTEIGGALMWGMKKMVWNSYDFSTVVIPTWCVSHA